jgi:hypothetical protein
MPITNTLLKLKNRSTEGITNFFALHPTINLKTGTNFQRRKHIRSQPISRSGMNPAVWRHAKYLNRFAKKEAHLATGLFVLNLNCAF